MRLLPPMSPLLHVTVVGEDLMGATRLGLLPLYRYLPLQAALHSGQEVPLAPHWPEHLQLFIYSYSPVQALRAGQLPTALDTRFGGCARQADRLRPWEQATYQGWPLYVFGPDEPGGAPTGTVAHLFGRVSVDLLPLPPPGDRRTGP